MTSAISRPADSDAPEELRMLVEGFAELARLSQEDSKRLLAVLESAGATPSRTRFMRDVRSALPNLDARRITSIVDALVAFGLALQSTDLSFDEVVQALLRSSLVSIPASKHRTLASRIKRFASLPTIHRIAQSVSLRSGSERTFYRAELSTDIRTAIEGRSDRRPVAASIFHRLSIECHEPDGHKTVVVSMTDEDVTELIKVLRVGEANSRVLRPLIDAMGLSYVPFGGNDE